MGRAFLAAETACAEPEGERELGMLRDCSERLECRAKGCVGRDNARTGGRSQAGKDLMNRDLVLAGRDV